MIHIYAAFCILSFNRISFLIPAESCLVLSLHGTPWNGCTTVCLVDGHLIFYFGLLFLWATMQWISLQNSFVHMCMYKCRPKSQKGNCYVTLVYIFNFCDHFPLFSIGLALIYNPLNKGSIILSIFLPNMDYHTFLFWQSDETLSHYSLNLYLSY